VLPEGTEQYPKSTGNTQRATSGAAKSAALGTRLAAISEAGVEHQSDSAEKTPLPPEGSAESGAVESDLAIVIEAWPMLSAQCRSKIRRLAREVLEKKSEGRGT